MTRHLKIIEKKSFFLLFNKSVPFFLFLLSFTLRLSLIGKGPFELDGLALGVNAIHLIKTGQLQYLSATGYPLATLLGAIFIKIANTFSCNDPVTVMNFMSICLGAAVAPLQYELTKNLINEKAALFSATMIIFIPILFLQSLFAISTTIFLFFLLAGLYYLTLPTQRESLSYFLSSVCLGLAAAVRLQDVAFILPAIVYFFLTKKTFPFRKRFKALTLYISTIILILFLFYIPAFWGSQGNIPSSSFFYNFEYSVTKNFLGLFSRAFPKAISEIVISLTLPGLIISCLGFLILGYKNHRVFFFLALWMIIPLFLYGNIRALCQIRYLSIIMPPLIICQSYLLQFSFKNTFLLIAKNIVFVLLITVLFQQVYPIALFRHRFAVLPDFCRWVGEKTQPTAKVIVTDEELFIQHYGKRQTLHRPASVYGVGNNEIQKFKHSLDDLLEKKIPVYITSVGILAYNKNGIFSNFVYDNYELEWIGEHPYESWHLGATQLRVLAVKLYRLHLKRDNSSSLEHPVLISPLTPPFLLRGIVDRENRNHNNIDKRLKAQSSSIIPLRFDTPKIQCYSSIV